MDYRKGWNRSIHLLIFLRASLNISDRKQHEWIILSVLWFHNLQQQQIKQNKCVCVSWSFLHLSPYAQWYKFVVVTGLNFRQRDCVVKQPAFIINLLQPTGYVMHQQIWHSTIVRSAHTVFMCFVFIWEQTATCATYTINWLTFIT